MLNDYLGDGTLTQNFSEAQQVLVCGKKSYYVVNDIIMKVQTCQSGCS